MSIERAAKRQALGLCFVAPSYSVDGLDKHTYTWANQPQPPGGRTT